MSGLVNFSAVFPDLARSETRFIEIANDPEIPDGTYGLHEFYCIDPYCNCRVALIRMETAQTGETAATIVFGFAAQDCEPFLDPLNPQSENAPAILALVQKTCLAEPAYVARLAGHYKMMKDAAGDPRHPGHALVHGGTPTLVREEPRIGRNEPCPCGSGKKYKKCCLGKEQTVARIEPPERIAIMDGLHRMREEGARSDELEDDELEDDELED